MAFTESNSGLARDSAKPTGEDIVRDWVVQATAGNRHAFHHLMVHYQERVYRMVYYRVRCRIDAEDLTQDIFLQSYRNLSRLKEPGKFHSWIYRIAINRIHDFHRKKRFMCLFGMASTDNGDTPEPPDKRATGNLEKEVLRKEFWRQVQQLLRRLSRNEREVFMLRFFDDLGIKEIAETMGKSESTIKTSLYRAIQKFSTAGQDLCQFLEEAF